MSLDQINSPFDGKPVISSTEKKINVCKQCGYVTKIDPFDQGYYYLFKKQVERTNQIVDDYEELISFIFKEYPEIKYKLEEEFKESVYQNIVSNLCGGKE
jgi:hypothetical protein